MAYVCYCRLNIHHTHRQSCTSSSSSYLSVPTPVVVVVRNPQTWHHSIYICCSSSRRRQWDSTTKNFFNLENDDDNDDEAVADDDDDDDEDIEQWAVALEEYIDSLWILKVFGSYGWMLPVIVISMLVVTGPKAFLLALALPLGQSTFAFAFQRMQQERRGNKFKPKRKSKAKKVRSWTRGSSRNAVIEDDVKWKQSQGARKKRKGYQSWVPKDNVSVSNSDRSASRFGGWDELDAGTEPDTGSSRNDGQDSSGSQGRVAEEGKLNRRWSRSDAPLLLRLLISIFPFLEFIE